MRAACEYCGQPQPGGWQSGDLCVHCGQAVRRDVRCFWCVKWTPSSGRFCRHCAAGVVEARLFGAARMLKEAGVDRFGVPKMLAELDPDQIANFTNIYQRHASVLTRHVDHLGFLESFLQHKNWSDSLEEELIPQLPWPDERLRALSPPASPAEYAVTGERSRQECLAVAHAISAVTPFPQTQALAAVVRLLLDDWEAQPAALQALSSGNALLRGEAAIALTNWRVVNGPGIGEDRRALVDALRECPFQIRAAVQLAMLGEPGVGPPVQARDSSDPDVAFTIALASGNIDQLVAAERETDSLKRFAAARQLVRLGNFAGVGDVLGEAEPPRQIDLLRQITYKKKPVPELREVVFELLTTSGDKEVRKLASFAVLYACQPGDAPRIARAANGDGSIYQRLFQTAEVPPEDLESVCELLLEQNTFRASQWGMAEAAAKGRLPASFVPRHWAAAHDADRIEMCKLAEMQLEQYADEDLHRFFVGVVFGDVAQAVQLQAWIGLFRWYQRSDSRPAPARQRGGNSNSTGMGPLRIQRTSLERFFGSVPAFVRMLTRFLGRETPNAILSELFVREPLAKLLRYAEPDVIPGLLEDRRATLELAAALQCVMKSPKCELILRLACIDLLGLFATAPELRPPIADILSSFRGTDLDLGVSTVLDRIGTNQPGDV